MRACKLGKCIYQNWKLAYIYILYKVYKDNLSF